MAFFSFFITTAFATTFLPRPLPKVVDDNPNIVRGTVGTSYSDWGLRAGGSRDLFTFYQFQPTEVFKGTIDPSKTIVFREMGGEKDGMGMQVPGAGKFTVGEDVVLMLGPVNPDGTYDLRGLSSGKYNLLRQADGSEALVGVGLSPAKKWTLADLRQIIRDRNATPVSPTPQALAKTQPDAGASQAPQLQKSVAASASNPLGEEAAPLLGVKIRIAALFLFFGVAFLFLTRSWKK